MDPGPQSCSAILFRDAHGSSPSLALLRLSRPCSRNRKCWRTSSNTDSTRLTIAIYRTKTEDSQEDDFRCHLATRPLRELRPDPSYARYQLQVSASQLSSLAALRRLAFREPIVTTRNGIIIDGYARWELARRQGRQTIPCLEYDLTDEEALRWLIQSHRPSRGLNSNSRVLLALDLEPRLQERARANQQAGGQNKGRQI